MKRYKILTFFVLSITLITLFCGVVSADYYVGDGFYSEGPGPISSTTEKSPPIKETAPVGESLEVEEIPVEKMPIVDKENTVKEIPNTKVIDVPQDNVLQEVQKIRIAIEILVYGAFPVCVAVLILVKLLAWFGKHYAS